MPEVLFKLFEQLRLLNEDIKSHISIQDTKKQAIRNFEKVLMKEEDYKFFLQNVHTQAKQLYELSLKFSEITVEAKRILDSLNEKSDERKKNHGVDAGETVENHHRELPPEVKQLLDSTVSEVSSRFLTPFSLG